MGGWRLVCALALCLFLPMTPVVQATTYTISIGALNTVSFTPSLLTISPGDVVLFNFTAAGDSGEGCHAVERVVSPCGVCCSWEGACRSRLGIQVLFFASGRFFLLEFSDLCASFGWLVGWSVRLARRDEGCR
jgi:hypothetical protein